MGFMQMQIYRKGRFATCDCEKCGQTETWHEWVSDGQAEDLKSGRCSDCGEEIELDVIAICCDYAVDTPEDIASSYNIDLSECEDDDERREAVVEYLDNVTQVVDPDCNGQIVYMQF